MKRNWQRTEIYIIPYSIGWTFGKDAVQKDLSSLSLFVNAIRDRCEDWRLQYMHCRSRGWRRRPPVRTVKFTDCASLD